MSEFIKFFRTSQCIAALVIVAVSSWTAPTAAQDMMREQDYGWARQIVPILYGRKAKGHDEIKVIGDMASALGRPETLAALMDADEFIDHWADVLVDSIRVNRSGDKNQRNCLATPLRADSNSPALANAILLSPPTLSVPGPPFNLADLLNSSIAADNLAPFFRAYLFAMANKPLKGAMVNEVNIREDMAASFEAIFLHRKNTCLSCHNSAFSKSGPESFWDRTHPIPGNFELAIYGANTGADPRKMESIFRTDALRGGLRPWNMVAACGSFEEVLPDDSPMYLPTEVGEVYVGGNMGRQASVLSLDEKIRVGMARLRNGLERSPDERGIQSCSLVASCNSNSELPSDGSGLRDEVYEVLERNGCIGCHRTGAGDLLMPERTSTTDDFDAALVRRAATAKHGFAPYITPGDCTTDISGNGNCSDSFLYRAVTDIDPVTNRPYMPPAGDRLTEPDLQTLRRWINALPNQAGCGARSRQGLCPAAENQVDGEEALAFLLAASITNIIWQEAMGYPLTIAHYLPRNEGQRDILWHLTETVFLPNDWSLKTVLAEILMSPNFNHPSPYQGEGTPSPLPLGETPYDLPMIFNPWVEQDPRRPPAAEDGWTPGSGPPTPDPAYDAERAPQNHHNNITEASRRFSATSLVRSVGRALGWPAPSRFSSSEYPRDLMQRLGRFETDSQPGFRDIELESFLLWEQEFGSCGKPDGVASAPDWIDRLDAAITSFDASPENSCRLESGII